MDYAEFLKTKTRRFGKNGFRVDSSTLPANIFPWQRKIVEWAVAKSLEIVGMHRARRKNYYWG